jgi:HSP20 family protein
VAQFTFMPTAESPEIADDVRAMFEEIAAGLKQDQRAYSGELQPALDVLETDRAVEIVMDVAGVPPNGVRVLFRAGIVIVAGEKGPPAANQSHAFHLVEREFGRFVRAVRLTGAFDIANSRASLHDGELTIVLPKLTERRGRAHDIRIA